jgi:Tol biopolymer transport system component
VSASGTLETLVEAVLFTSDRTGNRDLWALVTGIPPMRLTTNPGIDDMGVVSPPNHGLVGSAIAYVSDSGNPAYGPTELPNTDIWVAERVGDTLIPRRVTNAQTAYCSQPQWSPDGSYIVYVKKLDGQTPQVWRVNVATSQDVQLTSEAVAHRNPEWGDGYQIVYDREASAGVWELWRMNPDGTGKAALATTASSLGAGCAHGGSKPPAAAPTKELAYIRASAQVSQVRKMRVDGANDALLHDNSADAADGWGQAAFSPADSVVAASVYPSLAVGSTEFDSFIQLLDPGTGAEFGRITGTGQRNTFAFESSLPDSARFSAGDQVWNEAGSRLVYMSDAAQNWEVYMLTLAPPGLANLTNNGAADSNPSWMRVDMPCSPAGPPTLTSPANAAEGISLTPGLDWAGVAGALSYEVQVDDNPDFSSPVVDAFAGVDSYSVPAGLLVEDQTYYWRVRAYTACGAGAWSAAWQFHTFCTAYPGTPTLLSPADGEIIDTLTPTLDWTDVIDATSYQLQVDVSPSFPTPVEVTLTPSQLAIPAGSLVGGHSYYWRVRARNRCGPGSWAGPRLFHALCANPPGVPTLLSPADGATLEVFTPRLDWSDVTRVTNYQVQVASSMSFSSPEIDTQTTASEFTVPSWALSSETTYYWRVRGRNSCGIGGWTATRRFTTPMLRTILLRPGLNQISLPVGSPSTAGGRMPYPCNSANLMHGPLPIATWSNAAGAYTFGAASDLLTPGVGYFVEVQNAEDCWMAGGPVRPRWDLLAGWNLIGGGSELFNINPFLGDCTVTSGPWRWDDVAGDYLREDTLRPGAGYFVKVAGPCTLGIASTTGFVRLDGGKPGASGPVLMEFEDVPGTHFAHAAVGTMRWLSITGGCSARPPLYCPEQVVTRAQIAVFMSRFLQIPAPVSGEPYFQDMPRTHLAFRYVQGLREAGLTRGCAADPPLFCPEALTTRAQMAVLLARALKLEASEPERPRFADVPADYWAGPEVAALAEAGIVRGCSAEPPLYCPDELVTRAQLAVFLDRALK